MCDNCGESTHGPLIGGECVRKCSNSVPVEALQELVDEWQRQRTGDFDVDRAVEACADELEALIEGYQ